MFKLLQFSPETSLRNQLFSWLIVLLLPLIFISALASFYLANQFTNLAYDKSLYRTALALADQVSLEALGVQVMLPQVAKDLLEFDEDDDVYFRILGPKGDLITTHTDLPLPRVFPKPDQSLYYNAILQEKNLRVVVYALPITTPDKKENQSVYVMVGETLQKRALMKNEIIISMLLPQLLILLLVGTLLFFGIKRGLHSLDTLKENLSHRNVSDLNPIDDIHAPTELQPLLHAFNDLLARLRSAVAKQQRFISDAAHQLKTPLAGLKTQTELALREKDPEKTLHALGQINHASSNLSHVVSQLLALNKAGQDASTFIDLKPLDIDKLAEQVCAEWVNSALQKNIDLGFEGASKSVIEGNEILLRELMNNLIDNAIRYTPNGGQITVGVLQEASSVIFFVKDSGIGITEENQTLIFERFYRVLGTQQEGCGLGLTIVQEIAERHGATVTVQSDGEDKGTLFQVKFAKV